MQAAITPHLTVKGGPVALDWYGRAFGARTEFHQMAEDGERLLHATLSLFGGQVMLHDAFPEHPGGARDPEALGGCSTTVHVGLQSPDAVDAAIRRAEAEGAAVTMPPADMFWGDRYGRIRDPFGHHWSFGAPLAKNG